MNVQKQKLYTHYKSAGPQGYIPLPEDPPPPPQLRSIPPGAYVLGTTPMGPNFQPVEIKQEPVFQLPCPAMTIVMTEIQKFWDRRERYRKYGVAHKRGILLYGPPGSGKSTTIRAVSRDVIARNGMITYMTSPALFRNALTAMRQIQDALPVVVILEDLEEQLDNWGDTEVINMLDGFEELDQCLFIATTNHIEKLPARVKNRPSRFDRKILVDYPLPEHRQAYLEHLDKFGDITDLKSWVDATEGMSLAHLKELFTSVVILETSFEETLANLKAMSHEALTEGEEDEE